MHGLNMKMNLVFEGSITCCHVDGIETKLLAGQFRVQIPVGARDFSVFHKHVGHFWDPPSFLFNGYWISY